MTATLKSMIEAARHDVPSLALREHSAPRSGRVLVYCKQAPGVRSLLSAQTLASMGYEESK